MGSTGRGATIAVSLALVVTTTFVARAPVASADDGDSEPVVTQPEPPAPAPATEPEAPVDEEADPEPEFTNPAPAPAAPKIKFTPVVRYNVKRKLVYPIIGVSKFWDGFGGCRDNCTREHHGIDIVTYGWKGLPVVAAHDGTVVKVTYDEGNPGCSVRIRARDRWETRYYHLNNDLVGTDEQGAGCPAPGIVEGAHVVAGQIIGYVGDSGNAETTVPHLHFELRSPSGYPIDPYRSLKAAAKVVYEWLPTDNQAASIVLSNATHADTARMIVVVPSTELHRLGGSETSATVLTAPLVAIDPAAPQAAIAEIQRLAPERIVGLTDDWDAWLRDMLMPLSPIVAVGPITEPAPPQAPLPHDAVAPSDELYVADRFMTIVTGVVDKIWRSRQEAYQQFITDHRSIVLTTDRWAPRRIGTGSWTYPGKYADADAVWWLTGDGWISTAPGDAAPTPGSAYVTERLAQPQTLAFLGSLAELPPMPVWKSS
jgi:murein DD-endopeptidase MepM/ murein hydrolase activator NlpD